MKNKILTALANRKIEDYVEQWEVSIAESCIESSEPVAAFAYYCEETDEWEVALDEEEFEPDEGFELILIRENIQELVAETIQDILDYRKDPYSYNGVSRGDFY